MIIAVDIDDVLADFTGSFRKYLRKEKGVYVRGRDLKVADWWRAWGKTEKEAVKTIFAFLHSPYLLSTKPTRGAKTAMRKLKKDGHKLFVITGRPLAVEPITVKWVERNFPDIFTDIYCTDFHIVKHGKNTKGKICRLIKADLIIDDYPGYARECVANGTKVLLFASPWNRAYKAEAGIIKVKNWRQVLSKIKKMP